MIQTAANLRRRRWEDRCSQNHVRHVSRFFKVITMTSLAQLLAAFGLFVWNFSFWYHEVESVLPSLQSTALSLVSSSSPPSSSSSSPSLSSSSSSLAVVQLPTVQLIGAQKCGSTALAEWLFSKGGIARPRRFPGEPQHYTKEVHFFSKDERYSQGLEFYNRRFNKTLEGGRGGGDRNHRQNHQVQSLTMDASPSTIRFAERVRATYDAAGGNQAKALKIVVILRDPIARELSMYNHMARECRLMKLAKCQHSWVSQVLSKNDSATIQSFDEFVQHATVPAIQGKESDKGLLLSSKNGLYAQYLSKWFDLFDRDQILVLSYHELQVDPGKLQTRVNEFLGTNAPTGVIESVNDQKSAFKIHMDDVSSGTMNILRNIYDPLNEELYQLLDNNPGPEMEQQPFPRFETRHL